MASLAKRLAPWTIMREILRQPSINAKEQIVVDRPSTWMDDVTHYIRDGILLEEGNEADRIK